MTKVLSVGLIGCGAVVHSNYAQTLVARDAYRVRYVCDTDPKQAASAAALFGAEAVPLKFIQEHAEAIIISTPPSTHADLLRACIARDRIILCEKPYMTTYDDAVQLSDAARAGGAQVYVGHFRRVFPQLVLARELVGLGLIGEVDRFSASEGGRFTWRAVSNYTTRDRSGGVLWDTGSHTIDMALFGARLDRYDAIDIQNIRVQKDKPEPSHDFLADFTVLVQGRAPIEGHVHVSRNEALPNLIRIRGSRGELTFAVGMDDRVRLRTASGSTVLHAARAYANLMECFDLQMRSILLQEAADPFRVENFLGQIKLIEALSNG